MKKILFVIAMEKEALEIKEKLGLMRIDEKECSEENQNKVYRKDNISLLITGIGKQQTAINLTRYLENDKENKPDIIINMGYAGSTNSKIGEWINICKSYNYEWNIPGEQKYTVENFDKDILKVLDNKKAIEMQEANIKSLPCYSAESFVTCTELDADVVFDMELHSIYILCCMYGINLISLKKVSDNLNLEDYYKNIDMKEVMELTSGLKYLEQLDL